MFCQKKHGGSVSSDSVLDYVSCKAFDTLDVNSTNRVGGFKIHHQIGDDEQRGGFTKINSYRRVLKLCSACRQMGGISTGASCSPIVDVLGSYGLNLGNVPSSVAQSQDGAINMGGISAQNQNVLGQPVIDAYSLMPNAAMYPSSYVGANPPFTLH